MRPSILLLRQVHPNFVERGRITSQVFKPTNKDKDKLSVDNGDETTPQRAFENFTRCGSQQSIGVLAVTVQECDDLELTVKPDPFDCVPSHTLIDFSGLSRKKKENVAKRLKEHAEGRGWQYCPAKETMNPRC